MAVQTRSVLKTYFETGDKPTSAQFGDLIDSALMANATLESASFNAVANTVHNITTSSAITCALSNLTYGESCVINRVGNATVCNATTTFAFNNGPLYYAAGYSDVSANATGAMSYAILIAGNTTRWVLINRAFYK
jgi:hypothetical protein